MNRQQQQKFIYGAIFLLANKLQLLGDQADELITTKQYFLLVTLSQFRDHSPTLTEMAHFMACSRQNTKKMAVLLEEKGMVSIQPDPNDMRSLRLHMTKEGEQYLSSRIKKEEAFYEELFANISEPAMDYLETGMLKLAGNLARMEANSVEEDKNKNNEMSIESDFDEDRFDQLSIDDLNMEQKVLHKA